jgi:hydrogenase maturation protease
VVVIGVGNSLRGDDGAGLEVARRLGPGALRARVEVRTHEGEALGLLELWAGARAAIIVDAVRSGAPPGTLHRFDVSARSTAVRVKSFSSTHALDVCEAVEFARALGRLPATVVLLAVEGRSFAAGCGLSPEVQRGLAGLTRAVAREARAVCAAEDRRGRGAFPP